ncbi:MAG: topoisomerase II [Coprococcus sp.]|nr:topoisomerase II [Coprococcus sp.]
MAEKILNVDYESEMGQSYVDYSMSVITERALPDIRDGLKPVQRRILYSLDGLAGSDKPHRKCARIVGDTMGKYHPHGDSSIYEGLVNLAQNWKLPIPLVDPHGNFGSVDGSGAAAMRYTEARISKYTEDVCMKDLQYFKDQFVPNFDGTETEPTFLPFQVPNILVSGSTGIAVGMATNIPSHNLGEVIDATIMYLQNPEVPLEELLEVMQGPDFATGGIINASKEELLKVYETGLGKIKVRGKVEVRDIGHGRKSICVTEIPFTMIGGTAKFLDTVAELTRNRELPAVVDIADRGDKTGECLCIDVKKGTSDEEINNIINILYKKAGLEDTFGVNINCINNGKPEVMGLKRILSIYTNFKYGLYTTKYKKLLDAQEDIREIKTGLLTAVDCIDLIIEILRGSAKVADAKACLMHGDTSNIKFRFKGSEADAKFLCFTEKQADAILAMRLQKLIGLEIHALKKELADAEKLIKKYNKLLSDKEAMMTQMIEDMLAIKEKYAIPRKTKIAYYGEVAIKKAEVVATEVAVLLDRFYYIKVVDGSVYDKNIEQITKDYRFAFKCQNVERIAVFADNNQVYTVKVQDIIKLQAKKNTSKSKSGGNGLIGRLSDKGIQIFEFCNMNGDENILYMGCIEQFVNSRLLFATKNGMAKLVDGSNFDITRKAAAASKQGDEMVYIGVVSEDDFIIAKSEKGYYIRVAVSDIPEKGKGAGGVKLISLSDGDTVESVYSGSTKDSFYVDDTEIIFTRIKAAKRGAKGTKLRIQ